METGKILITKTKKGFAGMLAYTKPNGQPGQMPILDCRFANDAYNDTECKFERDGGKITKLIAHDGTVLIDIAAVQQASSGSQEGAKTIGMMADSLDILDIQQTFLPRDVQSIAEQIQRQGIDNFALKLNKAAYSSGEGDSQKFYFYRQGRKEKDRFVKPDFGQLPIRTIATRQLKNVQVLFPYYRSSVFKPDWRMVVGLGGESVYETSITLHHIYGIPYIPGSSVKGVVRSWIITSYFSTHDEKGQEIEFDLEKAEERAQRHAYFINWFGSQDQSGKITFFDAFPTETPRIEPDVMNVHYQDYYSDNNGRKAPTDYQRTNPIPFLTVSGSPFQFILGAREKVIIEDGKIDNKSISDWLKEALESHGIGAKTAVGYGYFSSTPPPHA